MKYALGKDSRFGSLFFLSFFALGLLFGQSRQAGWSPWVQPQQAWDPFFNPSSDSSWTIVGVGDIMLGTNYPSAGYLPPNDGRDLLEEVAPLLRAADVAFGNLEGTILDKGGTPKRCNNPSACYVFRSPERYGIYLAEAGFDLMSLANNHSGDFGAEGRRRTKAVLRDNGIAFAGLAGTDEYAIVERIGLRACAHFRPTMAPAVFTT